MKKKILTMCLVVALAATALVGGTLAYFTDTDSKENVMTLGGVDIVQNEKQRGENGALEDFDNWKSLMPMVDTREDKENDPVVGSDGYFVPALKNVVDKIVSVENIADGNVNPDNKEAYVRTIFAFEGRSDVFDTYIGRRINTTDWDFEYLPRTGETTTEDPSGLLVAREVMINDVVHTVAVATYKADGFGKGEGVLPAGKETAPSLMQIFLAPTANNEVATWFGNEYTIYAVTQAVQVEGFTDAKTALNEAFGNPAEVDDQTMFDWFKDVK